MATTISRPPRRRASRAVSGTPYINRELSWLEFNARVLFEAQDERGPLLERVRFLSIFATNLDEFFQVRVAGLKQQVAAGHSWPSPDGLAAPQVLEHIRDRVLQLQSLHSSTWLRIRDQLAEEDIRIVRYEERPERQLELRQRYLDEIFPVLTPLAVDPSHPFPYISDLSLSLAVTVRDPAEGEDRFARIKVPPVLPRLWEVGARTYVLVEQIIAANLDTLFPGMEIRDHHLFRVTRNADISIEEDEADDLLLAMEEELNKRRFGKVVRLEVERSMPWHTRSLLQKGLALEPTDVYEIAGMLDLSALVSIADLDVPHLQPVPFHPVQPPRLVPLDTDRADVFAAIRAGDLLVHHPYESFSGSVQRFIEQAAEDPDVLSIKMTLYRTSGDSPIVRALIDAAEDGKQVVVMVELKARFDERANIVWARALERAGAHVAYGLPGLKTHCKAALVDAAEDGKQVVVMVELKARFDERANIVWARALERAGAHVAYGLPGLKTHCKAALVVRREGRGLRSYAHIGTGNYNPRTARVYTDLGLLTDDTALMADVTDLFNVLTGVARKDDYRRLLVAPVSMRSGILRLIREETVRHAGHGDGRIVMKVNSIVDPGIIAELYTASQAGVPIDLIVRGMCSLVPGKPGISETIAVRSVVGRFLEHSRILCFGRDDRERFLIGSADMMERNLDRRVEAMVPVEDPPLQDRLRTILEVMLRDDRRAWTLDADGAWTRVETQVERSSGIDTFQVLAGLTAASRAEHHAKS